MTQASLRAVTLKTVANYSRAAERAVGAYRAGGHRLIAAVQSRVDQAARRGTARVAPQLGDTLVRASDRVGALADQGVDAISDRTAQVIALGSSGVAAQIERVAVLAGGVDYPAVVSGLDAVARLSLPPAQAALALSERVAAGADKLYAVSGAKPARAARGQAGKTAKTAKTAPVRARRAAAKPAPQAAVEVVKKAAARAAKPVLAKVATKPVTRSATKPAAKPPVQAAAKPRAKAAPKARSAQPGAPAAAAPVSEAPATAVNAG